MKSRKLFELEGVQKTEDTEYTLVFYETADNYMFESMDEESKLNEGEAKLCKIHIESLI